MANCAICDAPNAELFTTQGELVCRACYYREQNEIAEQRAQEAAIEQYPEAMRDLARKVQAKHAKGGAPRRPSPPGTAFRRGLVVLAVGSIATVAWAIFVGELAIPFVLIAAVGFAASARGYQVRHYE